METFAVIGLGRFGSALAEELCAQGHQVLAIDPDEKAVQRMADKVTQAVAADCQDSEVLEMLGVRDADCAIVAFSGDIGASVLIALNLKNVGVPKVICKARSHSHAEILRRIGADRVVFPEHEGGRNLARALANRDILSYIELSEGFGIVKLRVPLLWRDKTLRTLDIRHRYRVNVIAIQNGDGRVNHVPEADYAFRRDDLIFALGSKEYTDRILELE